MDVLTPKRVEDLERRVAALEEKIDSRPSPSPRRHVLTADDLLRPRDEAAAEREARLHRRFSGRR
jgi:hypothetical protein